MLLANPKETMVLGVFKNRDFGYKWLQVFQKLFKLLDTRSNNLDNSKTYITKICLKI